MRYHPKKFPSAIERYQKEIVRVISVLDGVLSKQDWLVGGKVTVADLCFVPCVTSVDLPRHFLIHDFPTGGMEAP